MHSFTLGLRKEECFQFRSERDDTYPMGIRG